MSSNQVAAEEAAQAAAEAKWRATFRNIKLVVPYTLGCPPPPVTVANEGLGRDPLLEM